MNDYKLAEKLEKENAALRAGVMGYGRCKYELKFCENELVKLRADVERLKKEREEIVDHWMLQYEGWLDNINYTEADLTEAVGLLRDLVRLCAHVMNECGEEWHIDEELKEARAFLARREM